MFQINKKRLPDGAQFDTVTGIRLDAGGKFTPPSKCPKCRKEITSPLRDGCRCPECNRKIPQECKNCGTAREENAQYCISCGSGAFVGVAIKKRSGKVCPSCGRPGFTDRCAQDSCIKPLMVGGKVPNGKSSYTVKKILGHGAMGIVYLVINEDGKKAALKEIRPLSADSAMDPEMLFFNEVQAMSWLQKIPEAVKPLASFDEGDFRYILMSFLEGETFEDIVDRIPEREALRMIDKLTASVINAHQYAILRDLKSSNVMRLPGGGEVKLFDFGFAHLLNPSATHFPPLILGTPGFGPPEQFGATLLRGFAPVGHRFSISLPVMDQDPKYHWDTYAIGAILYQFLTKEHPTLILYNWDFGKIQNAKLRRIVVKCLEPIPGGRYQSAGELLQDLRAVGGY